MCIRDRGQRVLAEALGNVFQHLFRPNVISVFIQRVLLAFDTIVVQHIARLRVQIVEGSKENLDIFTIRRNRDAAINMGRHGAGVVMHFIALVLH